MNNQSDAQYRGITDIFFAVWNMDPPVNFIWVDFIDGCVRCGTRKTDSDAVADERDEERKLKESFVELISYDENGKPIYNFECKRPPSKTEPYSTYLAERTDLDVFLCDMEDIKLLDWKCQYPSMREGLCWRIDVYMNDGEKHLSGQTRYPEQWASFGKSLNGLVKKVQTANTD